MAPRDGFLRDILENPDDDAPRLIFADWLDENGDPERAEFIRVQIRLPGLNWWDEERGVLDRRQNELLHAHHGRWRQELPRWVRRYASHSGFFLRGFLGAVPCSVREWSAGARVLLRKTPLERLILMNWAGHLGEFAHSPHLTGIRSLWMTAARLSVEEVHELAVAEVPQLTELYLALADLDRGRPAALAALPFLPRVQTLDLTGNGMSNEAVATLVQSPAVSGLRRLNLSSNALDDRGVVELASSPHLGLLAGLELPSNLIGPEGAAALAASRTLTGLRKLDLSGWPNAVRIGSAGLAALGGSSGLAGLTSLSANSSWIGPEGVEGLATSGMRLVDLCLFDNPIGDLGAAALAGWPSATSLQCLGLGDTGIGPEGAKALAESPYLGSLRFLNLHRCPIGDAGAAALAASSRLAGLRWVVAENCGLSDHGRALLRDRFGEGDLF